ncbi:hypothetical protein QBC36DRAFT_333301 [Triangularia setosa]|uniref:Uncharacterized protein n=1 Tax=Triangularia setosa TaxID=2587417 RepID=A0AAN7A616_9PEZI|nr:hypothetical protein QBC36DRAFT_333301 [Podospora setosa]
MLKQQQERLREQQRGLDKRAKALDLREVSVRNREVNAEEFFYARELCLDAREEDNNRREAEVTRREKAAYDRDAGIFHRIKEAGLREEQVYRREMAVLDREQFSGVSSPDITSSVEITPFPETECEVVESQGIVCMDGPESRYNRSFQGTGRSRSSPPDEHRIVAVHGAADVRRALFGSGHDDSRERSW